MRVLMISSPSSVHTYNWVSGLAKCGVDVDVLFVRNWLRTRSNTMDGLPTKCFIMESSSGIRLFARSLRSRNFRGVVEDLRAGTTIHQELAVLAPLVDDLIRERDYELVHAHWLGSSALLAQSIRFRPFTISSWGSDMFILPKKYPYLVPLMRRAFSESAFVHVQSPVSANAVRKIAAGIDVKLVVATWGVDTGKFKPGIPTEKVRSQLGLPESRWILSARALRPLYRIDTIVRAFALVANRHLDVNLVIMGDGPEKHLIRRLVSSLELDDRVFFTGFLDRDSMSHVFSGSYFYIQFPSSDGVSQTVMEAMSSGLPVVSSDVGEVSTIVVDDHNGLLIEDDTPGSLAKAMLKLLDDPQLRNSLGKSSRADAVMKHDRSAFFRGIAKEMRGVVSKHC